MEEIKFLSQKAEEKLSFAELKKYYDDLRSSLKDRTYTNLTPGALFLGPKLKSPTNQIAEKVTKLFQVKMYTGLVTVKKTFLKDQLYLLILIKEF